MFLHACVWSKSVVWLNMLWNPRCSKQYCRIINTIATNSPILKLYLDICPWTFSVPRNLQFSSSSPLRKLFTSWDRWCQQKNIHAKFCAKWSLYAKNSINSFVKSHLQTIVQATTKWNPHIHFTVQFLDNSTLLGELHTSLIIHK